MFIEWRKVKNKFYPYVRWSIWNPELKKGETKSVYLGATLAKAEQKLKTIVQELQTERKLNLNIDKIDLPTLLNSLRTKNPNCSSVSTADNKNIKIVKGKPCEKETAATIDQPLLSLSEAKQSLPIQPQQPPDKPAKIANIQDIDVDSHNKINSFHKEFSIELCDPNVFWSQNLAELNLGTEEERQRIINCQNIFDIVLSQSK